MARSKPARKATTRKARKAIRRGRQQPGPAIPALPVSRPQAVRMLGLSDRTFARLEAQGVIVATSQGAGRRLSMYDAFVLVPAYLAYQERKLTGSVESPRDRRDRSQAALNELRLARERREVLPRDQVVREGQAFVAALTAKIRALPNRMAVAGVIGRDVETSVGELLREALAEIARWQTALDLLQVAEDGHVR